MIIVAALLMMQAYSPETEAVMNRSRQRAADKRAEKAAQIGGDAAASNARQGVDKPLPMPPEIAVKFQGCLDAGTSDPDAGVRFAEAWRIDGGGFHARECMGFALARAERWPAALVALEQAADEAERAGSMQDSARLWAQAGNAALAGGDPAKAKSDFDAALARGLPDGVGKGEVQLDRARTMVALKDLPAARIDLDNALEMVPQDPLAWLLSATLARRMNNLPLAQKHIAQAVKLSPDDASVALEEGNIAILSSHEDIAKAAWDRAVKIAPDSGPGKAAAANLVQLAAEKPAE